MVTPVGGGVVPVPPFPLLELLLELLQAAAKRISPSAGKVNAAQRILYPISMILPPAEK
jgi:hypothetical protein